MNAWYEPEPENDDYPLTIEEIGKALAGLVIGALGLLLLLKGRVGPR